MTEIKFAAKTTLQMLALLLATLASGLAQERIELQGRVTDITGAPLPGASVFVRDLATGLETSHRADSIGAFAVEVRAGTYRVSAAQADFETASEC